MANALTTGDDGLSYGDVSIVVPTLNEIEQLPDLTAHLQHWQRRGCEVLLVDGGSEDGTAEAAEANGFVVIRSSRGRARQMNAGMRAASGRILIFLHADTRLPGDGVASVLNAVKRGCWGRFDVRIRGDAPMLRIVSFFMNLRSRLTGIATGDQAIFVTRALLMEMGGFPDQPLMEDIELSRQLKRRQRPVCLSAKVSTSGRRWLARGVWPTIWLMWRLRWAYWRGTPAEQLAEEYR